MAPTLRAALLLLPAILPIAGGLGRALVALRGPDPHVCACPLDAEGDCQCPDCILLGIHDRHDAEHEGAEPARLDPGPQIASACTPAPGEEPAPPALERAVLPGPAPVLAAAPYTILTRCDARPLSARKPEPPVPPPRLA